MSHIRNLPNLTKALEKNDVSLLKKAIEEYGQKLCSIEIRKRAPETDIFEILIEKYQRGFFDINVFEDLCKHTISKGCVLWIHQPDLAWDCPSRFEDVLLTLKGKSVENGKIHPFIQTLFKLCSDPKKIQFEIIEKWLSMLTTPEDELRVMRYLIDDIGNVEIIDDCHSETGNTILHLACKTGNLKLVHYLLNKGFEVNIPNKEGVYPIGITPSEDITKLLLKNDPSINSSGFKIQKD